MLREIRVAASRSWPPLRQSIRKIDATSVFRWNINGWMLRLASKNYQLKHRARSTLAFLEVHVHT